ncbi:DUF2797 domain-containing protein [Alicyclobacillus kakegawensis]|uniref:DUF2797 domain-containing protein n=1 Tax=Alicyclobacillus kakegawensis TaxID=392012 RepID=UPI00082FD5C1|nr:DUF2797 domain-containing protein [Alicyclobacillus kakegawensis]
MFEIGGYLRELTHQATQPIYYRLHTDDDSLVVNAALGRSIRIRFLGDKACIHCGRKVKKLYQNGYCFPCVRTLAECDLCVVKPQECHYHQGTCRDAAWGDAHCMIPHYVYLAVSSDPKVGLTRKGRELTRWVDQGAVAAVLFAEVPTRRQAGELEMELAQHIADKTNWRKMLADEVEQTDLLALRKQLIDKLPSHWRSYVLDSVTVHRFSYPRAEGQLALQSLSLDRTQTVEGRLIGVKGQYLLLSNGVFHVKKHVGYRVQISVS